MTDKIFAVKIYTGTTVLQNHVIKIANGKITAVEPGTVTSGLKSVHSIAAGFIDAHINGGKEFHFTDKANLETVADIARSSRAVGTAYTLPALITSPLENIFKGIDAVRAFKEGNPELGTLGIHLEGPFMNPLKRGAHLLEYIKKPTDAELKAIIKYGKDVISMITIAPEFFTDDQIKRLLDSDITVSLGHSNATYEEASNAFALGVNLVTHLYNAMSSFSHRSPGLVGAAFDHPSVYAPIILDGAHCDFSAARIAYKIKKDKLFLISDALFVDREVKKFKWGLFDAELKNDQYINSDGNLAGASISLGEGVYNAVNEVGVPLQEAIEMATIRPAAALGVDGSVGKIEKGYRAVFTIFDDSLTNFEVLSF
jgi:N-acetylglucosamine-6-phosphate deacetylase